VVHAYALVPTVRGGDDARVLPAAGIGGSPVRLLDLGALAVVVGDLDASRFGEDAWREHAEDPAWLEPVARGHHEVLKALASAADVLPLRLPGIYPDDDALARALGREEQRLLDRLNFVTGHDEWGVQVFGGTRPDVGEEPPPASGREYLLRRKQAAAERDEARADRHLVVVEAYEALSATATSSVLNRPQDRALSGRAEPMLLNSAHLVSRELQQDFVGCVDRVSRETLEPAGLVMEVSGPWPPYNFASPADPSGGGGR
jgi:hypothetical protein